MQDKVYTEEKPTQGFGRETWKKDTAWKTGVDGRMTLKWILKFSESS